MKHGILALFAIVAISLPAAGVLRAHSAAAQSASTRCPNYQLLVTAQSSQGAAGHLAVIYRLHNLTGTACMLDGYPGVELLNRNFQSLPTTVHRGGGDLVGATMARPVRIPGYGNAYFTLGSSDVPVGNHPCQPAARYILVTPPNDYLPVVTYAFTRAGSITSCTGDVYVSPVEAQPQYR
jgi:hypothetical protein